MVINLIINVNYFTVVESGKQPKYSIIELKVKIIIINSKNETIICAYCCQIEIWDFTQCVLKSKQVCKINKCLLFLFDELSM